MNGVAALALRELSERKLLFMGAALVAVITLLVPLTPIPGGYKYGDVVDLSAFVFALLLMVGGGIVLGATTIGRDLSSGRITFFFTRQLHAWEIWFGRIVGMFVTLVLASIIVMLPATIIGGGLRNMWSVRAAEELVNAAIFAVLLPLAAHYISVALRSRSAWLALDVVAVCVALALLGPLSLPFLPFWFGTPRTMGVILALLTVILALAGWVGLAKGRSTPVAVHRWSAFALWSLVALALLSFAAWRVWVFSASPSDIGWSKSWAYEIDGNGEWIGLGSEEKGGRGGIPHEFVMSTKTGAWFRVSDTQRIAVSADRRVAVIAKRTWAWKPPSWVDTTMQIVDLTASRPRARDLGIVLNELTWSPPALSADGSRLAIVQSKGVSVYSLQDEKLLAAFPLERSNWTTALFVDARTLQVVTAFDNETVVSRFDITRRQRISRAEFKGRGSRIDAKAEHVAVGSGSAEKPRVVRIYETTSGAKVGEAIFPSSPVGRRFHWLVDGGFALATIDEPPRPGGSVEMGHETPRLTIHAIDGTERMRIPFPGAKRIVIAGEQRHGELIVVWSDSDNLSNPCTGRPHVDVVDMASGSLREVPFEGWPKSFTWRSSAARGTVSTRLFSTCDGKMVMLDAATGEQRVVLGGR